MSQFNFDRLLNMLRGKSGGPPPHRRPGEPPPFQRGGGGSGRRFGWGNFVTILLGLAIIYAGYFWFVRRYVVDADEVLVLLKKNGDHSLPGDQVVIPNPAGYPGGAAEWEKLYDDANGIVEQVYMTGTYFGFSPFDYE